MIETSSTTSKDIIASVENRIGARFPKSFVEFLSENDGAEFKDAEIQTKHSDASQDLYGIRQFLAVEEIGTLQIEYWDNQLIAIAEDSSGNFFVFQRSDMDAVYFWDHETGETTRVSKDFREFLNNIQKFDVSQVQVPDDATGWIDPDFLAELKNES